MKKKIFSLAIAAIAALGISASAQTNDNTASNNAACGKEQAAKGDKMARPHRFTDFAFEGILLELPQQARIDSLNSAMKIQREQALAQRPERGDRKEMNKGQACADTACVAPNRGPRDGGKRGARGMNQQARRDYVAKVKEILTPEQYTVFLENILFMPENVSGQQGPRQGMAQERGRRPEMGGDQAHRAQKFMKEGKAKAQKYMKGEKAKAQKAMDSNKSKAQATQK